MRDGRAKTGSIRGAFAALLFACLALAVPSMASAGWTAAEIVSGAGSSVSQTRVAGGTDGTSWVVWKRNVGGFDVIQGTRVQMDGTQGSIETISGPAANATDPVIASRADGSAMVAWLNTSALDDTVQSRSIAADGTLGAIQTRSTVGPSGQPAKDIALALGDDGTAGLAWIKFKGTFWVVQSVKVGADDSSGAIHDLSAPLSSAGKPDIAAAISPGSSTPYAYRTAWPQGTGDAGNVYTRQINADDSTDGITKLIWPRIPIRENDPQGPGTGGDPHDVQIGYSVNGLLYATWVRYRTDYIINGDDDATSHNPFLDPPAYNPADADDTPYYNWAVESITALPLPDEHVVVLNNLSAQTITPLTPVVPGVPYNVDKFQMMMPFGGQPVMTWVHNINGGGKRVETGRFLMNGTNSVFQPWADGTRVVPEVNPPVISANTHGAAIAGWTVPGLLPGQDEVSWTRFSNSSFLPLTPSGDFTYSDDPGFVVADSGLSMAVFTGIDGSSVGSVHVMTYTSPAMQVDPNSFNFGRSNIGVPRTSVISVRSAGETPNKVTGITLSGPNADRYSLSGQDACITNMNPNTNCRFEVTFTPSSTATQTAKVTVTSESGVEDVNLSGSGLNQTRNRITAKPGNAARRKGKVVKFRVKASNLGGVASNNTRICVNLRKRALKLAGNRCRSLGALAAGTSRNLNYRIRVTWRAHRGVKLPVTFVMRANNAVVRQAVVRVRRKGK